MTEGVSVVICTYNGANVLEDTLNHLFAQTGIDFPFEIILVDNNSKDDTLALVTEWFKKCPFEYSILEEKEQGKAKASRTGFNAVKHSITLVCDDDNRLDPEYISKGFRLMQEQPNIGVLGGMGFPETEMDLPEWFHNYEVIYAVGKQHPTTGIVTDELDFIWGAGMFFRTAVWHAIRDFKPTFYLNEQRGKVNMGGDDVELCEFVRWCGMDLYIDNSLTFKHRIPTNRLTLDFIRSRFKGLGASSLIMQIYMVARVGNRQPLEYNGRLPYWMDRTIHMTKALWDYREDFFDWMKGKKLETRLTFLADVSRIKMMMHIKNEYLTMLEDLLKKKEILEKTFQQKVESNG